MMINEFYAGKNVFITGGTGFLGKVLIEKLLRSCPDIGNIYILIREKKGLSIEQRIKFMKELSLFDVLRNENPDVLNKIIPVKGDVREMNLGLSEADRQMLVDNVNVIYHTAASVRFDDFLKDAIFINVRATREISKLALDLKNISIFVHVSTTYCNADKPVIQEKCYPAHANWKEAIEIAEQCDESLLSVMTEKYIRPMPNTYTFAKSLGEDVVDELCRGKIPVVIMRPSVVISTIEEPIVGWNDNFNGPVGLLVAGGKGILRIVYGNADSYIDYIPVDMVIKLIIAGSRDFQGKINTEMTDVINICQGNSSRINLQEVTDVGKQVITAFPFSKILWHPNFPITNCFWYYYINVILFHMIPAFFIDTGSRLIGMRPMLLKIQRKIYIANVILKPFMSNTWEFENKRLFDIKGNILPEESDSFGRINHEITPEEIYEYFVQAKNGAAKYLLKEDVEDFVTYRKNAQRLRYLDLAVKTLFYLFLFWLFIVKLDLLTFFYNRVNNYFSLLL